MLRNAALVPLSFALAAASVAAQRTTVIPAEAATQEGSALSAKPFSYDRCRHSQYYGDTLLRGRLPTGARITQISYRRDGRFPSSRAFVHTSKPSWQIRMGNYTRDAKNPSSRYLSAGQATNQLTPVFNQVVNFPTLGAGFGPMPFELHFKLARPFLFGGQALVVDHFVYETRNRFFSYYVDAVRVPVDHGSYASYGKACPATSNRAAAVPSNPGGDNMALTLHGARPRSAAIGIIGSSRTRYASANLPFPMDIFGLKGCWLNASIDMMLFTQTLSTGSARLEFAIPEDRTFLGIRIYGQWIVVDPTISRSFPFTMSNGVAIQVGSTLGKVSGIDAAVIYGISTVARSSYGFRESGVCLVTRFTY